MPTCGRSTFACSARWPVGLKPFTVVGHGASGNSKFGRRADHYGSEAVEYSPVPSAARLPVPTSWQDDASWRPKNGSNARRIGEHRLRATLAQVVAQLPQKFLAGGAKSPLDRELRTVERQARCERIRWGPKKEGPTRCGSPRRPLGGEKCGPPAVAQKIDIGNSSAGRWPCRSRFDAPARCGPDLRPTLLPMTDKAQGVPEGVGTIEIFHWAGLSRWRIRVWTLSREVRLFCMQIVVVRYRRVRVTASRCRSCLGGGQC